MADNIANTIVESILPSKNDVFINNFMELEQTKTVNAAVDTVTEGDFYTRCSIDVDKKSGRKSFRPVEEALSHGKKILELEELQYKRDQLRLQQQQPVPQPAPSPSITIDYDKLADIIIARGKHKKTK